MKVVHMTSVHSFMDVRIMVKECASLCEAGFDVQLIAAGVHDHEHAGVKILGVKSGSTRLSRMLLTTTRIYLRARKEQASIYHFHDPELLIVGLLLRWSGRTVIYDAHEDVPRQILSKYWIPSLLRRPAALIYECVENFVVKRLSGVVAATPHIAKRFRDMNPNTININNYPKLEEFSPREPDIKRMPQICYVGGISSERGIPNLIAALPFVPGVRLVLCGRFIEPGLENKLRELPGWKQVDFRGHVDRKQIVNILSTSSAGLVTLLPIVNYLDALPVKMFEYMAAELPVIASDFPRWSDILRVSGAGLCVNPTSPEDIGRGIRQILGDPDLIARMGKCGREAIIRTYNWTLEADKLINYYEKLTCE